MKNWRYVSRVSLLGAFILLVLMWALDTKGLLIFDFNKAALLVLIFVNLAYTVSTELMARTMENQRHEGIAPVIELDANGITDINIAFRNVGMGPALNFRCWVEDNQYPNLRNNNHSVSQRAIGVDQTGVASTGTIRTGLTGYQLGQGYIRAQYEDSFGLTYESCLIVSTNALPELKYGRAKDKVIL